MPDNLRVTLCEYGKLQPPLNIVARREVAVCAAGVYGRIDVRKLQSWVHWYHMLGVKTIVLYSIRQPEEVLENISGVTWIIADWLLEKDSWERGQLWTMHDCFFRMRLQGVEWVFFADVDEYVYTTKSSLMTIAESMMHQSFRFARKDYAPACHNSPPATWASQNWSLAPAVGYHKHVTRTGNFSLLNIHNAVALNWTDIDPSEAWIMHCVEEYPPTGQ